jgi:hypothetical protein
MDEAFTYHKRKRMSSKKEETIDMNDFIVNALPAWKWLICHGID